MTALGRTMLVYLMIVAACLMAAAVMAKPKVEHTDAMVEAMEQAYKAGYAKGIQAKLDACEQGDLRSSRFNP